MKKGPYRAEIETAAAAHGLDPDLIAAIVEQESSGRFYGYRFEPAFYDRYLKGNVEDPFGPLENLTASFNQVFGFQLQTTWSMFELLGMDRPQNTRWNLMVDYMSYRGPAAELPVVWMAVRAGLRRVLETTTIADLASGVLPEPVTDLADEYRRTTEARWVVGNP